ncbi:hypothetical protein KR032_002111 [Drosophila birchii]|nr:hypothetical protein KR032_002111 [Drosophila birchii]
MPPWTDHGGSLVAMCGKDCVAIATDYHPGPHHPDIPDANFKKVFKINPRTFVGLAGLQLDILAVRDRAINRHSLREVSTCGEMSPKEFSIMLSNLLAKQRSKTYYVEPMVVGLEPDLTPFICCMDWIGCRMEAKDFLVAGTSTVQLMGMCKALWQPNMEPADLFKVISMSLHCALGRDPTTRLGTLALVFLIEENSITERLVGPP